MLATRDSDTSCTTRLLDTATQTSHAHSCDGSFSVEHSIGYARTSTTTDVALVMHVHTQKPRDDDWRDVEHRAEMRHRHRQSRGRLWHELCGVFARDDNARLRRAVSDLHADAHNEDQNARAVQVASPRGQPTPHHGNCHSRAFRLAPPSCLLHPRPVPITRQQTFAPPTAYGHKYGFNSRGGGGLARPRDRPNERTNKQTNERTKRACCVLPS